MFCIQLEHEKLKFFGITPEWKKFKIKAVPLIIPGLVY
jgi:hypothetical protein